MFLRDQIVPFCAVCRHSENICMCCLGGWFLQAELFILSQANHRGDFFPLSHNEPHWWPQPFNLWTWCPEHHGPMLYSNSDASLNSPYCSFSEPWHKLVEYHLLSVSLCVCTCVCKYFICLYLLLTIGYFCYFVISFSPSADTSIFQGSQNWQTLPVHCLIYCLQI